MIYSHDPKPQDDQPSTNMLRHPVHPWRQSSVLQILSPASKSKPQKVKCTICNVTMLNEIDMKQHLNGKRHRINYTAYSNSNNGHAPKHKKKKKNKKRKRKREKPLPCATPSASNSLIMSDNETNPLQKNLSLNDMLYGSFETQTNTQPKKKAKLNNGEAIEVIVLDSDDHKSDRNTTAHHNTMPCLEDVNGNIMKHVEPLDTNANLTQIETDIIALVPLTQHELFNFNVDWMLVDGMHIIQNVMKHWLDDRFGEYLGEQQAALVNFVMGLLIVHCGAIDVMNELQCILKDDTEQFVVKMWRRLVFEILKVSHHSHRMNANHNSNKLM
eukprot:406662_1